MAPKDTATTSLSLVVKSSTDVEALSELEGILTGDTQVDESTFQVVTDPAAAEREIIRQLLDARTDDELEGGDAIPWRELQGVPIRIDSFKYLPSTFKSTDPNYVSNPVYFVVFGQRMDVGESVVLTTGSKGACAQLVNLAKRGRIPGAIRMFEAVERKGKDSGNTPYRLVSTDREKAERRAEKTEQA